MVEPAPAEVRARTRIIQNTHVGCKERRLQRQESRAVRLPGPGKIARTVPELLERHDLGEKVLIQKNLLPLLEAEETKLFKDGAKRINVEALTIRHAALRTAFELHGSYAPRENYSRGHSPATKRIQPARGCDSRECALAAFAQFFANGTSLRHNISDSALPFTPSSASDGK